MGVRVVQIMTTSTAVISLDQVSLGWRDKVAVRDVSGQFMQGGLYALAGPNGAGKSTLLKGLAGQLAPLKGKIQINSPQRLAFLPQFGELDRSFPISVYDLVAMGSWRRTGAWRGLSESEHQRVQDALCQVGLQGFSERAISTLSGGQMQRALFARLIMHDAPILLLDEPFSAVDKATTDDLMVLLHRWHQQGRTVIVVLHDLHTIRQNFPETVLLAGQLVAWGDTESVLTAENLHLARHLCEGDYL
jgi:zinc/manganese transport system ATP-binding protein